MGLVLTGRNKLNVSVKHSMRDSLDSSFRNESLKRDTFEFSAFRDNSSFPCHLQE